MLYIHIFFSILKYFLFFHFFQLTWMWLYLWFFTKNAVLEWIRRLNYILNVDPEKQEKNPEKLQEKGQNNLEWPWIWFQKITRHPVNFINIVLLVKLVLEWAVSAFSHTSLVLSRKKPPFICLSQLPLLPNQEGRPIPCNFDIFITKNFDRSFTFQMACMRNLFHSKESWLKFRKLFTELF